MIEAGGALQARVVVGGDVFGCEGYLGRVPAEHFGVVGGGRRRELGFGLIESRSERFRRRKEMPRFLLEFQDHDYLSTIPAFTKDCLFQECRNGRYTQPLAKGDQHLPQRAPIILFAASIPPPQDFKKQARTP